MEEPPEGTKAWSLEQKSLFPFLSKFFFPQTFVPSAQPELLPKNISFYATNDDEKKEELCNKNKYLK